MYIIYKKLLFFEKFEKPVGRTPDIKIAKTITLENVHLQSREPERRIRFLHKKKNSRQLESRGHEKSGRWYFVSILVIYASNWYKDRKCKTWIHINSSNCNQKI